MVIWMPKSVWIKILSHGIALGRAVSLNNIWNCFLTKNLLKSRNELILDLGFDLIRIWWIFVFVSSVIGCVVAIHSIWNTWTNRPVTVTFDDTTTHIEMIPFPAVTICTTQKLKEKFETRSIFEE